MESQVHSDTALIRVAKSFQKRRGMLPLIYALAVIWKSAYGSNKNPVIASHNGLFAILNKMLIPLGRTNS